MKKLIFKVEMTLDGFISGPKGEMDWGTATFGAEVDNVAKVVFSKTLESVDWMNSRLVKTDAGAEIALNRGRILSCGAALYSRKP